ncbi:hypothetical protein PFMG_03245 [Plasmodium falciparum IGH-CR14]|uniref:Protein transport protein SEC23 n=1 Tax=Plasmodium falciparum IGH-CR14 TaxID=580059 RepID=A0A0L1ID62_PLAFA|nr:hypothetical protein PFMG_03245 [Plasmodium falciparum IGH-CR14]
MDIHAQENQTGIRFSWNLWPPTKAEAAKIEVPLGCLYTVLKRTDDNSVKLVEYEPLKCKTSNCILNPYCNIDFRNKTWTCPFSNIKNPFPLHYAEHISEKNLPADVMYSNIEYIQPSNVGDIPPPTFLFVIDTCLLEEELEQLKDSIQQCISLMPGDAYIGIITFGNMCYVHEIGFNDCLKSYVFKGNKEISAQDLQKQLNLGSRNDPRSSTTSASARRFLQPVSECEYNINMLLEDIQKDNWPTPPDQRAKRCTGVALSVAIGLLECCCNQLSGRVMMFIGGADTTSPGKIVDTPLSESLRHHLDLQKENSNARHVKKALKYYVSLANRAVASGHAIDIFACSLDQIGLYEMKVCCEKTNGFMVMADSFSMNVFKDSFKKIFETDSTEYIKHGYNAKLTVICSKEFRVCGAIGACSSNKKTANYVSDTCVGEGGTCEWTICALDRQSTIAFYFEIVNQNLASLPPDRQAYLQFQTLYQHPSGRRRLRVTTISYRFAEPNIAEISQGFDQETAAVIMARFAVLKAETDEPIDVLRWLDRKLIRLVSTFADYQKDDINSFHLSSEFSIYPQFMYHLRRSHFLQTFNASPDETAYYRSILLRENVMNSLIMIQPALLQYSFDSPTPIPVLLDAQSLKSNVILLLDSYFHIVIWYGEMIYQWREQGFHEKPEYEHFRQLLNAPHEDAKSILEDRFPIPKFVLCNSGGSQSRFLLAKVNPSTTHNSLSGSTFGTSSNESYIINTDDVSLKIFMDHLVKLAVQT